MLIIINNNNNKNNDKNKYNIYPIQIGRKQLQFI